MTDQADQRQTIPVIDIAPLLHANSQSEAFAETGKQMYSAFKEVGFAYVKNHCLPQDVVDQAFEWTKKFFALPQSEKDKVPPPPEGWYHRGYSGVGREKVSQMVFDEEDIAKERKIPDVKESYEMGIDEPEAKLQNIWPDDHALPGFREFFVRFYDQCYEIELKLLRAIATGMGIEEDFFINFHLERNNQTRLLHYPSVEEELVIAGKVAHIGAHTDFGTMTLLFQDEVGGLEVLGQDLNSKSIWISAPPIPGTIVVNIGDLLMRWSNDELRSTMHRVRTTAAEVAGEKGMVRMTRERYSIPYFVGVDSDRMIDCVPGCWGPNRPKRYEPVNSSEYVDMRLNATY